MKNFLKRFEKLENKPVEFTVPPEKLSATRRFEYLEINERRIGVSITDSAAKVESAPQGLVYYSMCSYCGEEVAANAKECPKCRHAISEYAADYGGSGHLIKKCTCGAMNLKERKFCWVCGRDFSLWGDEKVVKRQDNLIVVNIDGTAYRSDDPNLPPGIVKLMERIRREGYSKKLIDDWVNRTNQEQEDRQDALEQKIRRSRSELNNHILRLVIGISIVVIYVILRLSFTNR